MTLSSRSSVFWILYVIFSVVCIGITIHFFPKSIPIIHIDLTMDRSQAIAQAQTIATQLTLGPSNAQNATSFHTDNQVKTFVELEGGGKNAFVAMMENHLYEPYTWQVRHFKPYDVHEVILIFTPNGTPYGFLEKIPEDQEGAHLDVEKARTLAEMEAIKHWHINFDVYKLVETSKEVRPSGRADHAFVYERIDHTIGEGKYRLRVSVCGDHVSELIPFIQVPDSFNRRYQEMRSANDTIAWAAQIAMMLLYIIGGCIIGLFILFREHWVLWRIPLLWGLIIALLDSLTALNNIPLLWVSYPTALAPYGFLLRYLTSILYQFLYKLLLYTMIFMAAESLTRKAFGNQLQLWTLWQSDRASSWPVWGRTLGGYLIVPVLFAFVSLFYIFTTGYLGWWMPSDTLFDPNILATYMPWFSSVATALRAGFMEECLFRAVPLASAFLLAKRYGKPYVWLIGAFIIQAFIFGAAHANYPMQPAYARVIELLIPSSIFGGLYLAFGLLPAIISHVVYDIVWMALPVFLSAAPSAWINQLLVILLALLPVLIIVIARVYTRKWVSLTSDAYNKSWQAAHETHTTSYVPPIPQQITFTANKIYALYAIGILSLSAWLFTTRFTQDAPPLTISREQARTIAQAYLHKHNITLGSNWRILTAIDYNDNADVQHRFVWQEGGNEIYHQLLGTYLTPPHWIVRFAQFEGDIIARAEEYYVFIQPNGTVLRMQHILPENAPGVTLDEQEARTLAYDALQQYLALNKQLVKEISAVADQRPARKDWTFSFVDEQQHFIDGGQPRIRIIISGDQITDWQRFVHVPEMWQRTEQNKQNIAQLITQLSGLVIYLLFIAGMVIALLGLTQGAFDPLLVITTFGILLVLMTINTINIGPSILVQLSTSKPWVNQLFMIGGSLGIGVFIKAAAFALTIGFVSYWRTHYRLVKNITTIALGISIGLLLASIESIVTYLVPATKALWADYSPLNTLIPLYTQLYNLLIPFISFTILWLLLCSLIDHGTQHGTVKKVYYALLLFICGFLFSGILYADNLILYLTFGGMLSFCLIGIYFGIVRFDHALIPIIIGTLMSLHSLQFGIFNAYPYAWLYALFSIVIIAATSWIWFNKLNK